MAGSFDQQKLLFSQKSILFKVIFSKSISQFQKKTKWPQLKVFKCAMRIKQTISVALLCAILYLDWFAYSQLCTLELRVMDDVKNLLTLTLVVMTAGSSIYTIKTFMKPGMDLNINLEESSQIDEVQANSSEFTGSTPSDSIGSVTTMFPGELNKTTILSELTNDFSSNKT